MGNGSLRERRAELEARLEKGGLTTAEMAELAWLRAQKGTKK